VSSVQVSTAWQFGRRIKLSKWHRFRFYFHDLARFMSVHLIPRRWQEAFVQLAILAAFISACLLALQGSIPFGSIRKRTIESGHKPGPALDEWPASRLLLTSDGLSTAKLKSEFCRMLGHAGDKTMWYIPTAALADGRSLYDVRQTAEELRTSLALGRVEIIDVEHVQGKALREALAALAGVDVVYAEKGNTYALRYHLRASGADGLICAALASGAIYVGASAGSIVAGRTVQMAFWKDWDDRTAGGTIDVDWSDATLAQGLDLANGLSIFPHADGPYGCTEWQDTQAEIHGHTAHEVVRLRDGEALILEEGRLSVIS